MTGTRFRSVRALIMGVGLAVVATPTLAAGNDGQPGTAKRAPKNKPEKTMLNLVEKVAFPHEDHDKRALVVAKVPPPERAPRAGRRKGRTVVAPPVVQAQPGVAHEPTPPPAAAAPTPVAAPTPPPPTTTLKPQEVPGETGKSIDDLVAKAFTAPPPNNKPSADEEPATGGGSPNTEEIAAAMKPVSAQIKSACRFGERGVLTVRVEVGARGKIADVTPEGPLASRREATCVANAVKRVRLPQSAGASFRYPFPVK